MGRGAMAVDLSRLTVQGEQWDFQMMKGKYERKRDRGGRRRLSAECETGAYGEMSD